MTSRERVLKAANHQEPDRVPIDLGGTYVTGIMAQALAKLRRHMGLEDSPIKVIDVWQMLGEVELDLVEHLEVDVLPVQPAALTLGLRRERWKHWRLPGGLDALVPGDFDVDRADDGTWLLHAPGHPERRVVATMPSDGYYFDQVGFSDWDPGFQPPSRQELRTMAERWELRDEDVRYLADQARLLRQSSDKALVLSGAGTGVHYVGSFPEFLCLLTSDREYVRDLFALANEVALRNLAVLWEAIGTNVDFVFITGLDLGSQTGELISPDTFADLYIPPLRDQFSWVHEHTPWKTWEHMCGSIPRLIPHLVEAGLDVLNPVQTSAAGMDPRWLKDTFGHRLTFWGGGVETQSTLEFGTPEQVRQEVAERLAIFGRDGGFVFCPIHNIQYGVPAENILAAYEAVVEYGSYPIRPLTEADNWHEASRASEASRSTRQ